MKAKFSIEIEEVGNRVIDVIADIEGNKVLIGLGLANVLKQLGQNEKTYQIIETMEKFADREDIEDGRE